MSSDCNDPLPRYMMPLVSKPELRQRRYVLQPRVDPTQEDLPWVPTPKTTSTPTALRLPFIQTPNRRNAFGVEHTVWHIPRVGSCPVAAEASFPDRRERQLGQAGRLTTPGLKGVTLLA